eukprot:3080140-Rhodomonas_salina.1
MRALIPGSEDLSVSVGQHYGRLERALWRVYGAGSAQYDNDVRVEGLSAAQGAAAPVGRWAAADHQALRLVCILL